MKSALRNLTSLLVLFAAWLSTGSVAEAVAPLPNTRIDQVYSQRATRTPMIQVLPEWARADLGSPLSVREEGRGYFASTVRSLKESLKQPDDKSLKSERVKKAKKTKRVGNGPESSPPSGLEGGRDPGDVSGFERGYADLPMFHEPLDRPYGRRPSVPPGRQATTQGQVPEPPGSTLAGIALIGWLVTVRRRPR